MTHSELPNVIYLRLRLVLWWHSHKKNIFYVNEPILSSMTEF